jgi:hypothetical protein
MTIYMGKSGLTAALGIKLTDVLYISWIWQWCSILHSQADASRPVNLCHQKRTLPARGELVSTLMGKYAPKHQIVHLELPMMCKPLVIAPERLTVPCIAESCLPSSLIDEVDITMPELVHCAFILFLACQMSKWIYDTSTESNTEQPIVVLCWRD